MDLWAHLTRTLTERPKQRALAREAEIRLYQKRQRQIKREKVPRETPSARAMANTG